MSRKVAVLRGDEREIRDWGFDIGDLDSPRKLKWKPRNTRNSTNVMGFRALPVSTYREAGISLRDFSFRVF